MDGTVAETEIQNVACPLWDLLNYGASWPGIPGQFDLIKSGASAVVAHLAYCAIGDEEREQRNRATVVPCRVYQTLIEEAAFDFPTTIYPRAADFPGVEVVQTKYFVMILIPVREDRLFVGVRGTLFAYDWAINLSIAKAKDRVSGAYFHVGFLREAEKLNSALEERLMSRYAGRDIYIAGHSLGGAVAALINRWQHIQGCYIFGTPRIGNVSQRGLLYEPFATRRHLDIVPHCPPSTFRYTNFKDQIAPNGQPFEEAGGLELYFFGSWLLQLSLRRFPQHHSVERYRLELLQSVKQNPDFDRWLAKCPDIEP